MDLSMPDGQGLEATRRLDAQDLGCEVLVLAVHAEEEYPVPIVEAGAGGCLAKTSADNELVGAIRVTARGEVYLPSQATWMLFEE